MPAGQEQGEGEEALLPQKSVWHEMVLGHFGADDDHSARNGDFVYCGYDFKPALPPAGPDLFLWRSWPPLHSAAPSLIAGTGRVRGPQLRRITAAISDGELRTSGPVVKVAGAICTAMVQIPLLCRLHNRSLAEARSHRRLYVVLSPIWSTLARLP